MKKRIRKMLLMLAGAAANFTAHGFVTYGSDAACDYQTASHSLQDVLDLGESNIRLTNQSNIPATLHVKDHSFLLLVGGYNNCDDANFDVLSNTKTTLLGDGQLPVVRINVPQAQPSASVYLNNLVIKNGHHTSFHNGGGVSAYDLGDKPLLVVLENSLVTQNTGSRGGGVYVRGENMTLILRNSFVVSNDAEGQAGGSALGGGVYCHGGFVSMEMDSGISNNEAYSAIQNAGHGGGLYATNGCYLDLKSGTTGGVFDFRGISYNRASGHGGGIYASADSRVRLLSDDLSQPINVNGNQADANQDGYGDGGGIFITGAGTSMSINGGLINENFAVNGAGISIQNGALISLFALGDDCWSDEVCNQIRSNQTVGSSNLGGGVHLNAGQIYIHRTHITHNRADDGVAIYAENGSSVNMHRVLVARNGQGGGQWADRQAMRFVDSHFTINQTTSALNDVVMATVSAANSAHVINNSIFHEPITNQLGNFIGGSGSKNCNLVDNNFGWNDQSNTYLDDPSFVDANNDDFHIQETSAAIDRCNNGVPGAAPQGGDVDIDGQAAPVDHPDVVNGLGYYDIGADEFNPSDVIFRSNFDGS